MGNKKVNQYSNTDLEYYLGQIKETEKYPYSMNNKILAMELFEQIKEKYSNAKYYEHATTQWIVVSKEAEKLMLRILKRREASREKELEELRKFIREVEGNG